MKIYELPNALFDDKPATYIGETDQKIDVGGLVKFNNKYYNCCRENLKENSLYVRFLDYYLPGMDEDYCNDNLRCHMRKGILLNFQMRTMSIFVHNVVAH